MFDVWKALNKYSLIDIITDIQFDISYWMTRSNVWLVITPVVGNSQRYITPERRSCPHAWRRSIWRKRWRVKQRAGASILLQVILPSTHLLFSNWVACLSSGAWYRKAIFLFSVLALGIDVKLTNFEKFPRLAGLLIVCKHLHQMECLLYFYGWSYPTFLAWNCGMCMNNMETKV